MVSSRLGLNSKIAALILLFIVIFALFLGYALTTLNRLKVNGPVYHEIVQGKDLVADILPPPEYIMESYLVVLQLLETKDQGELAALIKKSEELKAEYMDRHTFWEKNLSDSTIKSALLERSYHPAVAFFEIMSTKFIPAISSGNKEIAHDLVYGPLRQQYEQHRAAIDQVVQMTEKRSSAYEEEAAREVKARTSMMYMLGICSIIFSSLIAFIIARSITKPLKELFRGLKSFSTRELNDTGQNFLRIIAEISSNSEQMVQTGAQLAESSSEQASSLEETSSSLEEMSSMTKQNADHANQARIMMTDATQIVEKVNRHMMDMSSAIADITQSSEETSKIIKTIDEIAFQTNLLALNAAVEAARAGEAGAGFAVVADEVRNLALRASEAAKNTSNLIENTIKAVRNGNELTSATQEAFKDNAEISKKISQLVDEIATASNEQAQGILQLNIAVSEMDKVVQQNAATAESSASAAEDLAHQAQELMAIIGSHDSNMDYKPINHGEMASIIKRVAIPMNRLIPEQ